MVPVSCSRLPGSVLFVPYSSLRFLRVRSFSAVNFFLGPSSLVPRLTLPQCRSRIAALLLHRPSECGRPTCHTSVTADTIRCLRSKEGNHVFNSLYFWEDP
jgi:hypothetical protein